MKSWRDLCERNNAFLFLPAVNSNKNNLSGLFWLFETKFNTNQLIHKRGICWLIIEMTEMAGMLGSKTFSPLSSSACLCLSLFTPAIELSQNREVYYLGEPSVPILSSLKYKRQAGLISAEATQKLLEGCDWPHWSHVNPWANRCGEEAVAIWLVGLWLHVYSWMEGYRKFQSFKSLCNNCFSF